MAECNAASVATLQSEGSAPHSLTQDDDKDTLPYTHFSARYRALIVTIAAITSLVSPLSSNMYYPSIQRVRDDLHTTQSGITWTVTAFTICMAVTPLFWSNLADRIGRKPVYAASMFIYTAGSIGCALSKSLTALVISRIIQSTGASAVKGSGAGTIADIYPRERRGTALGIYYLGPLVGPCIGPLVGGYVGQNLGWRWVFWILTIWGGTMCLVAMFVLPETHRRMVSMKHKIQQTNIPKPFNIRDNNPLVDLALIRYPPVYISLYFFAMVFGTYVVNLVGLALAFEDVYGLSQGASGLCYFPVGAGAITGSLSSGRITDLMLRRYQRRRDVEGGQGGKVPPETRIRLTWISGTMFLVSIALSGWIINRHWSLSALLVVQFFTGLGMAFSFHSLASYLIDVFPLKSARITGVQNFYRGMWGAVVVQLFPTMLDSIDWGWTYMILVFIAVPGLAGIQFLVSSGEKLRHRFGPH